MHGRKRHYVTFSGDRLGFEEQGRETCPFQNLIASVQKLTYCYCLRIVGSLLVLP